MTPCASIEIGASVGLPAGLGKCLGAAPGASPTGAAASSLSIAPAAGKGAAPGAQSFRAGWQSLLASLMSEAESSSESGTGKVGVASLGGAASATESGGASKAASAPAGDTGSRRNNEERGGIGAASLQVAFGSAGEAAGRFTTSRIVQLRATGSEKAEASGPAVSMTGAKESPSSVGVNKKIKAKAAAGKTALAATPAASESPVQAAPADGVRAAVVVPAIPESKTQPGNTSASQADSVAALQSRQVPQTFTSLPAKQAQSERSAASREAPSQFAHVRNDASTSHIQSLSNSNSNPNLQGPLQFTAVDVTTPKEDLASESSQAAEIPKSADFTAPSHEPVRQETDGGSSHLEFVRTARVAEPISDQTRTQRQELRSRPRETANVSLEAMVSGTGKNAGASQDSMLTATPSREWSWEQVRDAIGSQPLEGDKGGEGGEVGTVVTSQSLVEDRDRADPARTGGGEIEVPQAAAESGENAFAAGKSAWIEPQPSTAVGASSLKSSGAQDVLEATLQNNGMQGGAVTAAQRSGRAEMGAAQNEVAPSADFIEQKSPAQAPESESTAPATPSRIASQEPVSKLVETPMADLVSGEEALRSPAPAFESEQVSQTDQDRSLRSDAIPAPTTVPSPDSMTAAATGLNLRRPDAPRQQSTDAAATEVQQEDRGRETSRPLEVAPVLDSSQPRSRSFGSSVHVTPVLEVIPEAGSAPVQEPPLRPALAAESKPAAAAAPEVAKPQPEQARLPDIAPAEKSARVLPNKGSSGQDQPLAPVSTLHHRTAENFVSSQNQGSSQTTLQLALTGQPPAESSNADSVPPHSPVRNDVNRATTPAMSQPAAAAVSDPVASVSTVASQVSQSAAPASALVNAEMPVQAVLSKAAGGVKNTSSAPTRATRGAGKVDPSRRGSQVVAAQPAVAEVSAVAAGAAAVRGAVTLAGELAPGREVGSSGAEPKETFAALDSTSEVGKQVWVHAGGQRAEAGFEDPSLGWVGVRAESGGGRVHAEVVPGSSDAAQALSGHMAGLNAYLAEHHTRVETVSVSAPEGRMAGSTGDRSFGQQMQQGSGEQRGQQMADSAGSGFSPSMQGGSNARVSASAGPTVFRSEADRGAEAENREGIHISVMA